MSLGAKYAISLLLALVSVLTSSDVVAQKTEVALGAQQVAIHTPPGETLGDYFVVSVPVSTGLSNESIVAAFLEFYCDVDANAVDGRRNKTPIIEVYALTGPLAGQVDASLFDMDLLPMRRNVVLGEGRRIVIDVTQFLKQVISDPTQNNGLIVGSLTGSREGLFTLRTGVLPDGQYARLTIIE